MYRYLVIMKKEPDRVTCFCAKGFKFGACKHAFALSLKLKILNSVFLIENKSGRKRKSDRALVTMNNKKKDEVVNKIKS